MVNIKYVLKYWLKQELNDIGRRFSIKRRFYYNKDL